MKSLSLVALIVIIALVIVSAFAYREAVSPQTNQSKSICEFCFVTEPVGDVIIPQISQGLGGGVENRPLNLTLGQNLTLGVDVYLEITANVSVSLNIEASPGSTTTTRPLIEASFSPEHFQAISEKNASTTMTISVPTNAPVGSYSTLVVVSDLQNETISWGTHLEINVNG